MCSRGYTGSVSCFVQLDCSSTKLILLRLPSSSLHDSSHYQPRDGSSTRQQPHPCVVSLHKDQM